MAKLVHMDPRATKDHMRDLVAEYNNGVTSPDKMVDLVSADRAEVHIAGTDAAISDLVDKFPNLCQPS